VKDELKKKEGTKNEERTKERKYERKKGIRKR